MSPDQTGATMAKTTIVHKDGEEGGLVINAFSGEIIQPIDERPEWAAGLLMANPAERLLSYQRRLGDEAAKAFAFPDAVNYLDLQWEALTEDQEAVTIEADHAFRLEAAMEAGMHGLTLADGGTELVYGKGNLLAEVEIGLHNAKEDAEINAFNQAQETKFAELKTGTNA